MQEFYLFGRGSGSFLLYERESPEEHDAVIKKLAEQMTIVRLSDEDDLWLETCMLFEEEALDIPAIRCLIEKLGCRRAS